MDLAGRVCAFFREQQLLGTTGVVAVSGGPDSVTLAHLLLGLLRQGHLGGLVFAHLNHQLRGADSDADEVFVRELPATWPGGEAVAVRTARLDVARGAADARANLEDTARRERYRWLAEVARSAGAAWVATGHTADDQAETVLLRLLRGSGLQGIGGMAPRRPLDAGIELVRPLLPVRRTDVLEYLREQGLVYREDPSNQDPRFTRNRLRHELLPHLQQQYNPAVVDVLCRLATQARGVQAELSARAAALLQEAELPRGGAVLVLRVDSLAGQPAHLVAEMFRALWRRQGWPLDAMGFEDWQRMQEVLAGERTAWEFPGRVRAQRAGRVLQIKEPQINADERR